MGESIVPSHDHREVLTETEIAELTRNLYFSRLYEIYTAPFLNKKRKIKQNRHFFQENRSLRLN